MFERDTPINVLTKHCKGCVYFSNSTKTCDYLIMTEQRRPCPPWNTLHSKEALRQPQDRCK